MDIETIKGELKKLVAQGQNDKALERLLELSHSQPAVVSDQIYTLSSSYKKHKLDISHGILSDEKERQFANGLTRRLLVIINELVDNQYSDKKTSTKKQTTLNINEESKSASSNWILKKKNRAILLTVGLVVLVVSFLIVYYVSIPDNRFTTTEKLGGNLNNLDEEDQQTLGDSSSTSPEHLEDNSKPFTSSIKEESNKTILPKKEPKIKDKEFDGSSPKEIKTNLIKEEKPPTETFQVTLIVNSSMSDAEIYVNGEAAKTISNNLTIKIIEVDKSDGNTVIELKKNGLVRCQTDQKIIKNTKINLPCN